MTKQDKFSLTDKELMDLLLVSSVKRGLRVKNTDIEGEYYEKDENIGRDTDKETVKRDKTYTTQWQEQTYSLFEFLLRDEKYWNM